LIDADGVKGKRATSWASLRTVLTNAGARWSDEAVVADRGGAGGKCARARTRNL
jgi:protease I